MPQVKGELVQERNDGDSQDDKGRSSGWHLGPQVEGGQSRPEQARRLRDTFFKENTTDRIPDASEGRIWKLSKNFV